VLRELENFTDPPPAHLLAALVLALKPQEGKLRLLGQTCDVRVGIEEAMVRIVDGSRKRLDITSGFVVLRGEERAKFTERGIWPARALTIGWGIWGGGSGV
jgi:hypothetical protein